MQLPSRIHRGRPLRLLIRAAFAAALSLLVPNLIPGSPPRPPCLDSRAADPALLEELPLAGDILPGLPTDLKTRLFDAFDLQILWNKPARQATVFGEITDATLRALPAILNPSQDGYDDTAEQPAEGSAMMENLFESPIGGFIKFPNLAASARRLTIEATFVI